MIFIDLVAPKRAVFSKAGLGSRFNVWLLHLGPPPQLESPCIKGAFSMDFDDWFKMKSKYIKDIKNLPSKYSLRQNFKKFVH